MKIIIEHGSPKLHTNDINSGCEQLETRNLKLFDTSTRYQYQSRVSQRGIKIRMLSRVIQ